MLQMLILFVGSVLLATTALPRCEFTDEGSSDLVCTPDGIDFNLEYGLVSNNPNVKSISLRGCSITEIEMASFDNLPALESLDLSQNKLEAVRLGALDGFQQLKMLNLSYNQISGFELGLFNQKPNLEVLDLSRNMITNLQLGILDGFRQLKVLNLSDNRLTDFALGLFDQKPNLEYLLISRNSIINLELGVFDGMTKLKHVDMSNNPIKGKSLSPYLFDRSRSVEYIDFSSINMAETPRNLLHAFRALRFLSLHNCSLTAVPEFATERNLNTLTQLVLSRNEIPSITDQYTFVRLTNLEVLNLADNNIESIVDGVFAPLTKLKEVRLSRNRLPKVPDVPKGVNVF